MWSKRGVFFFVFVALCSQRAVNSQDNETCSYTCEEVDSKSTDNWAVYSNKGVWTFYLASENVQIFYNERLRNVLVLDGNTGTMTLLNVDTGFGHVFNVRTNVGYIIRAEDKQFDMTGLSAKEYGVVYEIYTYTQEFTKYVYGDNIDTSQKGYFDAIEVLKNIAASTDVSTWTMLQNNPEMVTMIQKNFQRLITIIYDLYASGEYTVQMGTSIYIVATTMLNEEYSAEDATLFYFYELTKYINELMYGRFDAELMKEVYELLISKASGEERLRKLEQLKWAVQEVGVVYDTLTEALAAYREGTVVRTHVSSITVGDVSYEAINLMDNGSWIFRVMYSNAAYVQITSSFTAGYLALYDSSMDVVLLYGKANTMAFIDTKTGSGVVVDPTTNKGRFVPNNDAIVSAMKEKKLRDAFELIAQMLETKSDGGEFKAGEFFLAIYQQGDLSSYFGSAQQEEEFRANFAEFLQYYKEINGADMEKFSYATLVAYMYRNTGSAYFQQGFVETIFNMFKYKIGIPRFYLDIYACFLFAIQDEWRTPVFENINGLLRFALENNKRDAKPDQLIKFIEIYINMNWGVDTTSAQYYRDGSISTEETRK